MGHIITGDDIVVDPEKIFAIMDFLVPTNVSEVQIFMGLVGYYHHFSSVKREEVCLVRPV